MNGLLRKLARMIVPERIPGFAADLYVRVARAAGRPYYRQVAQEVAAHLETGRLLDVGTGPGYLPVEIALRRQGVEIVAIDQTPQLLAVARRNAKAAGVAERVTFEAGDANNLRFADETFDMVLSTGVLHSLKQPVRVLDEFYRVLKPGGEAWVFDPARVGSGEPRPTRQQRGRWEWLVWKWVAFASRVVPLHLTPEQVDQMLEESKFTKRDVWWSLPRDEVRLKLRKT